MVELADLPCVELRAEQCPQRHAVPAAVLQPKCYNPLLLLEFSFFMWLFCTMLHSFRIKVSILVFLLPHHLICPALGSLLHSQLCRMKQSDSLCKLHHAILS